MVVTAQEELRSTCPIKDERRPVDLAPWPLVYPVPQPAVLRHPALHPSASALNLSRYHPYPAVLSPYARAGLLHSFHYPVVNEVRL